MKKLVLAFLVSALFAAPVFAQGKAKGNAEWDNKVKTELAMSPDQVAKYDALSKEYEGKINALKMDATMTDDMQKQKKMELGKEQETKVKEFLTPDQQTKYTQLMNKKRSKDKKKDKS